MASSEEEDTASSAGSEASEASSHASDASDAVPAVSDDVELQLQLLKRQLATLASCRPDVLAAQKRTALIQTVEEVIRHDPAARKLLAEWKGAYLMEYS
jgi:BRCT domain type II-containing protein